MGEFPNQDIGGTRRIINLPAPQNHKFVQLGAISRIKFCFNTKFSRTLDPYFILFCLTMLDQ
jgi:hypothetical protein